MILYFLLIFMNFVPFCFMGLHQILLNTTYFYWNRKLKTENIVVRIKWTRSLNSNLVSVQCNLLREQYLLLFISTEKKKRKKGKTLKRTNANADPAQFGLFFHLFCLTWRSVLGGYKGKEREREREIVWLRCVCEGKKDGKAFCDHSWRKHL